MLAVFEKITIKSVFFNAKGEKTKCEFSLTMQEITDPLYSESKGECGTEIILEKVNDKFLKATAKYSQENIADNILNHCLLYYLNNDAPCVEIIENNLIISLKNQFSPKDFVVNEAKDSIGNDCFTWYFVKNEKSSFHELVLCAHNRRVKSKKLEKILPLFSSAISDDKINGYVTIYVVGEYLDNLVNSSRTGFNFPKLNEDQDDSSLNLDLDTTRQIIEKDIDKKP